MVNSNTFVFETTTPDLQKPDLRTTKFKSKKVYKGWI
jgi:hypothetical protein